MITVFIIIGLVVATTYGLIKPKLYPFLLYFIGLMLVLQTTFAGNALIGGDIHLEYYYASWYSGKDVWTPSFILPQGTTISNSFIIPALYKLGIPIEFSMKLLYPLLYSILPVILYYLFKNWLNPLEAFLSSFFFISISPFFIEIPTIPRQMLAMPLLALFLLVLSKPIKYKIPILIALGPLVTSTHYTIGIILTFILLAALMFRVFVIKDGVNRKGILYPLASLVLSEIILFGFLYDGIILKILASLIPFKGEPVYIGSIVIAGAPPSVEPIVGVEPPRGKYLEPLIEAGLGLDFFRVGIWGKTFRGIQMFTEGLIILGLAFIKNRKYYLLASGILILLLLSITYDKIAIVIGPSRLYNIMLILLAPAFIVGFKVFVKDVRLLLLILIPYFLFTSGLVFEVAKQTDISKVNIPYSISLSKHRIDFGTHVTQGDLQVRDYVVESKAVPVFSDLYGTLFLSDKMGPEDLASTKISRFPDEMGGLDEIPKPYYVFLRSKNIEDGKIVTWMGPGMRALRDIPKFDGRLVYKSGDAELWEVK